MLFLGAFFVVMYRGGGGLNVDVSWLETRMIAIEVKRCDVFRGSVLEEKRVFRFDSKCIVVCLEEGRGFNCIV